MNNNKFTTTPNNKNKKQQIAAKTMHNIKKEKNYENFNIAKTPNIVSKNENIAINANTMSSVINKNYH